jgi:hypothetical protein
MRSDFRIDELVLRLPGISRAEAGVVGALAARCVAERLGAARLDRVPRNLNVRLWVAPGLSPERLAQAIAQAVLDALVPKGG